MTTKYSVMNLKINSKKQKKKGSLTLNYDIFKNVCMDAINKHAPLKGKHMEVYKGKSCSVHG